MQNHLTYTIDDLIGFGEVRMSAATAKVLFGDSKTEGELEKQDSGHHVGEVAFIHQNRAAVNERFLAEQAQEHYKEEHGGATHPDALGYYRARGLFLPGHLEREEAQEQPPSNPGE